MFTLNSIPKPKEKSLNFLNWILFSNWQIWQNPKELQNQSKTWTLLKAFIQVINCANSELLYNLLDMGNVEPERLKALLKSEIQFLEEENLKQTIENLIENLRIIEKIFIEQNLIKKGRTKKKFPKKGLIEKAYSSRAFK